MGRTSGAPAGVVPEVAITPGTATRPVTRGGDAPGDAPREKSGKFRKNRTKPGKITNKQAKIGQKRPKIIKTGIFSPGRHLGQRHPPDRPEVAATPGAPRGNTQAPRDNAGLPGVRPTPPLPGVVVRNT